MFQSQQVRFEIGSGLRTPLDGNLFCILCAHAQAASCQSPSLQTESLETSDEASESVRWDVPWLLR